MSKEVRNKLKKVLNDAAIGQRPVQCDYKSLADLMQEQSRFINVKPPSKELEEKLRKLDSMER